MNKFLNFRTMPYWAMVLGGLGYLVQLWLQSAGLDASGLYIPNHIAGVLGFLLIPIVLTVLLLSARPWEKTAENVPATRPFPFVGFVAAVLLLVHAVRLFAGAMNGLEMLCGIAGIFCAVAIAAITFFTLKKKKPSYLFYAGVTVYLLLIMICNYRHWSSEPQLLAYFFPLMAMVFLLLAVYNRTALVAGSANPRLTWFFWYAALYFCLVTIPTGGIFYGAMAFWLLMEIWSPVSEGNGHETA